MWRREIFLRTDTSTVVRGCRTSVLRFSHGSTLTVHVERETKREDIESTKGRSLGKRPPTIKRIGGMCRVTISKYVCLSFLPTLDLVTFFVGVSYILYFSSVPNTLH